MCEEFRQYRFKERVRGAKMLLLDRDDRFKNNTTIQKKKKEEGKREREECLCKLLRREKRKERKRFNNMRNKVFYAPYCPSLSSSSFPPFF